MTSLLEKLVRSENLYEEQGEDLLRLITDPRTDPILSGALLAALRTKGPVAEEVRGLANGMRKLATHVELGGDPSVDIVGTGGDGSGSLNLSTGSALLAAACGLRVAKHGNRAVSSHSGAADVLESLGYEAPQTPAGVLSSISDLNFAFLFAPYFHPAMKVVAPIRKTLGIRTVFNILGPLTNPASPTHYVIGAFSPAMAKLMAEALSGMDITRAFVVHGEPGWDEATPCGPFLLYDVGPGSVVEEHRDPRDYGVERCEPNALAGGNAQYNAAAMRDAFEGGSGPHADALALGAGLALEVMGTVSTLDSGIDRARAALEDGSAAELARRLKGWKA
jgi:anthranilate phosphoribosyltransferase